MKEEKTCKICGKTFTRRNYMKKHMENIHSKRYSCPKCFRFFSGPTDHSCVVENGKFLCYVRNCSLRFSNGIAMRLHIRDCHRKMDEDDVGEVMKSKKGVRELVQNLCKKINLLSNCFDELKYQVDNITNFLSSKDFGFEYAKPTLPKVHVSGPVDIEAQSELEYKEEFQDIDYIDEEYEEISTIEDIQEEDLMILGGSDDFVDESNIDIDKLPIILSTSISSPAPLTVNAVQTHSPTSESKQIPIPINIESAKTLPQTFIKASPQVASKPQTTTRGSTIITQIPANLVQVQNSSIKQKPTSTVGDAKNQFGSKRKNITTIKPVNSESPTPPLFLKIQYDTETTVCETDPKITFHFDTKPPDEIQEKFS